MFFTKLAISVSYRLSRFFIGIAEFVSNSVEPEMMADFLDKVMWGYAFYMLRDDNLCGHPHNAEALYWVKELRDTFVLKNN